MASHRYLSKWRSFFWLLVIVCVAGGAGKYTAAYDTPLYNYAAKALGLVPQERTLHLLQNGETAPPEPDIKEETRRTECPMVGSVEVDDTSAAACFAALPLGPQDFAVLLHRLSERGVKHLAVSAPLIWQEHTAPIARQMVAMRLMAFEHPATVGLRGRTAAEADFTPTVLRSCVIPSEQITGDTSGLPAANKTLNNDLLQVLEAQTLAWAPDRLEEERLTQSPGGSTDRSFPLLARWNGEIIPTLPLRIAMQIKGLRPQDIRIHIGKEIRLGSMTLPLDDRGRTRLLQAKATAFALAEVTDAAAAKKLPAIAVLTQSPNGKAETDRTAQLAATISQLCATEIVEYHTKAGAPGLSLQYRNPIAGWIPLSILAVVALFTVRLLPFFYAFFRHLFMFAAAAGILWVAYRMLLQGEWFPVCTAIATWLAAALALRFLHPNEVRTRRRR